MKYKLPKKFISVSVKGYKLTLTTLITTNFGFSFIVRVLFTSLRILQFIPLIAYIALLFYTALPLLPTKTCKNNFNIKIV